MSLKKLFDAENVNEFVVVALTAAAFVFAGAITISGWRSNWRFPTAGFTLGIIAGLAAHHGGGGVWGVIGGTMLGTIVGPNFIIALEGSDGIKKLADALLERVSNGKKDGE